MNDNDLAFVNTRIARLIERVEALESRPCPAPAPNPSASPTTRSDAPAAGDGSGSPSGAGSHAPSNPSSHGPSVHGGESPSSPSSSSSGPAGATGSSDSARRALADNNRPAWLTREAASTLPGGTAWVRRDEQGYHRAYPPRCQWSASEREWISGGCAHEATILARPQDFHDTGEVYHIPPAAKGEETNPNCTVCGKIIEYVADGDGWRHATCTPAKGEGDAWSRFIHEVYKRPIDNVGKAGRFIEPDAFNAFVASECERAVREAFPITAKAGRCAACKDTILDMGVRTGGEWYHNACAPKPDAGRAEEVKCPTCGGTAEPSVIEGRFVCRDSECPVFSFAPVPTPAPKPSPGEVAEGIVKQWSDDSGFWPYGQYRDPLIRAFEAAILRERTTP